MTGRYAIELEPGCWLATWDGDPGRTTVFENAKVFTGWRDATIALEEARSYRVFGMAEIVKVPSDWKAATND